MGTIQLNTGNIYPPLESLSMQERFDFACRMAQALPDVKICTVVGDTPEETVTLDGRVLRRKGAQVF
ncbi:hypothetical protein [Magnetospirillum sulfuroxidans]|uniref:Uncharacterized protein n=1 Tax=Magnetospirillum sulfuroxidans TaxID=611300 RepID=A0ABS5ID12_9PROT|nr:hypothetical protein [Magnetospirillum sulfuroxidans]MBR9972313.1 hypothetical protein [Magnetospirillum sulfuroxidans]